MPSDSHDKGLGFAPKRFPRKIANLPSKRLESFVICNAKGIKTEYSYDQHKRVSQMRKLPNGSTENRCERVDYFYDENGGTNNGRLTRMRWGWDASNNPCVDAATNFNIGFEESYTYNA
ncbi:hypothetical protein WDZ92_29145, partial [Nostoc sp. NIES-2111]